MHFAAGYFATGHFAPGYFSGPAGVSVAGRHFATGYFGDGYFAEGYFAGGSAGGGELPSWSWYRHPNFAESAVFATRAAGEASLVLADSSRFVVVDKPIRVTIFNPSGAAVGIYRVTDVDHGTNTLTISAAIEGTVDADIPAGYTARNVLTGADIDDIQDALDAIRIYLMSL